MKSTKGLLSLIIVVILTALCAPAHAFDLKKDVVEFKLDNGMRWLLVSRHQAPVFSGVVMVASGGADDPPHKMGLAHVFEHMAFKGTGRIGTLDFGKEKPILDEIEKTGEELTMESQKEKPDKEKINKLKNDLKNLSQKESQYISKNEIWNIMIRNGAADLNAFTGKDVTAYHSSMPINRLGLWMLINSQIITDPVYREFYTERDVILEERRGSVDDDPDGKMAEILGTEAFQNGPYHSPVIGSSKEVSSLTIADARAFHERYYIPSNMVGVLVGDINIDEAKKLIQKYFGILEPKKLDRSAMEFSNKGGGMNEFRFDAEPAAVLAYHKPALPNADEFVFDVINILLCDGSLSRLEKRLIYDEKIAREISCGVGFPGSRLDNLMLIWFEPNHPYTPRRLIKEVKEELKRLKTEPVSDEELDRAKKKEAAALVYGLEDNMGMAMQLAEFEAIFNNWRLLAEYPEKVEKVAADDVMRVAQKYFTKEGETVVVRLKGGKKQ